MNKIKILAIFGIFIAIFDFLFRGMIIFYSSPVGGFLYLDNLFMIGIVPLIAVLASYGIVKNKIFGLIFSIVLILMSLVKIIGIFGSDDFVVDRLDGQRQHGRRCIRTRDQPPARLPLAGRRLDSGDFGDVLRRKIA